MFHIELRQFPQNLSRFNLSEEELRPILAPWARGETVEVDERRWNPQQARLTILEGPKLSVAELSMGRGWRAAQRRSEDVTGRVLAQAASAAAASAPPGVGAQAADALSMGVTLATLLGADADRLLGIWREVAAQQPGLAPSESLAIAERRLAAAAHAPG